MAIFLDVCMWFSIAFLIFGIAVIVSKFIKEGGR